jgi:hypothetical protein
MSSAQALEALRTMHVVDIRVGAEIRRGVTAGNHQAHLRQFEKLDRWR